MLSQDSKAALEDPSSSTILSHYKKYMYREEDVEQAAVENTRNRDRETFEMK